MTATLKNAYRHLPDWFRRAILVRRRSKIWLERGIVFVHVPKAAGTSINHTLYGRFMGHAHAEDIRRWGSARLNALPSFSVVRNPWERLASAYQFARRGQGLGESRIAGMWKPERYRVSEFRSFEAFVNEWLAPRNVLKLDGVFQPQWLFVCDRNKAPLVEHVGRLEDLAPTYAYLERHFGSLPRFPRTNRSGEAASYRNFYTPDLVKLVGDIYSDDVSSFGYDF